MHGSRTAGRDLLPFALALGALAIAFYVAADILVGSCNPVISPMFPLVAGGLCVAAAVVLWLLNSYRHGDRRKPGALHWIAAVLYLIAILGAGLIAGATTTIIASFSLLGDSPLFDCLGQ